MSEKSSRLIEAHTGLIPLIMIWSAMSQDVAGYASKCSWKSLKLGAMEA